MGMEMEDGGLEGAGDWLGVGSGSGEALRSSLNVRMGI